MKKIFPLIVVFGCWSLACAGGVEVEHNGKPLGDFMKAFWTQALGGGGADTLQGRTFLKLPEGTDEDNDGTSTGTGTQTLAASNGFVLPMFVWVGERYNNGDPDDDPAEPSKDFFLATDVTVTLDGTQIIPGEDGKLDQFFFEPVFFDAPIAYETPTDYGADAALWVKGIGFLHAPLPTGAHTLHLVERNEEAGVGFDNTWTLTVN
jgi:hypothetical protein